jgi:hypothetical protein
LLLLYLKHAFNLSAEELAASGQATFIKWLRQMRA